MMPNVIEHVELLTETSSKNQIVSLSLIQPDLMELEKLCLITADPHVNSCSYITLLRV